MDTEHSPLTSLELHINSLQETLEIANEQIEASRGILERMHEIALRFQEFGKAIKQSFESVNCFLQELNDSFGPLLAIIQASFVTLPARTQSALILLGQHGWYFHSEMTFSDFWQLADDLKNGEVIETEKLLVEYFEERLSKIESFISTNYPHRSHLIRAAFDAHRRKDYALSIPVFLAQADGICQETISQSLFIKKDKKPSTALYVAKFESEVFMAALLSPLATTLTISLSEKERPKDFTGLNRHMVLHGESLDYDTKSNSVKAISLLNYIVYVLRLRDS